MTPLSRSYMALRCFGCGQLREFAAFREVESAPDGRAPRCLICEEREPPPPAAEPVPSRPPRRPAPTAGAQEVSAGICHRIRESPYAGHHRARVAFHCASCGQMKPPNFFTASPASEGGLSKFCVRCSDEVVRANRAERKADRASRKAPAAATQPTTTPWN